MDRFDYERELIVRIFQMSNALQTFLDKLLKEHKLTAKQFFMMIIMGTFDKDPRISDIAPRFGTSHQNVKQVLLKLEKASFVTLYKDPSDSRAIRVKFTAQAMEFWNSRNKNDTMTISRLFSNLNDEQLKVMLEASVQVVNDIEDLKRERV